MRGVSKDGSLVSEYAAHPSRRALQALLRMRAKLKRPSVQEEIRETSPCRGQCLQDRSHLPLRRFHAPAGIDQEMRAAAFFGVMHLLGEDRLVHLAWRAEHAGDLSPILLSLYVQSILDPPEWFGARAELPSDFWDS